jgi:large subunit ribosomal protein L35Ae
MRSPYRAWGRGSAHMAKAQASGTVVAFRQSKFKQDSYQTIVDLADPSQVEKLLGARVVWRREDGLQILGRVVARHGSKGAVRVRWDRGFPSQALGTQVKIVP